MSDPQHAAALALLRDWTAPDPTQEALRRRYAEHLAAHPDGLTRTCRPDHLTASTLVLDPGAGEVALTLHAKAGRWFQMGGHLEPQDADLPAAALREATEESGLAGLVLDPVPVQLSEHEVPFCGGPLPDGRVVHHLDVRFVALADRRETPQASEESLDVRWWPLDALPNLDPDLTDLVRLALARVSPARR